jgi:DNA-binding CsgD family transcriptional regulator
MGLRSKGRACDDVRDYHPALVAFGVTLREARVARLVACGYEDLEIAEDLGMNVSAANAHVASLLARLDIESRRVLVGTLQRIVSEFRGEREKQWRARAVRVRLVVERVRGQVATGGPAYLGDCRAFMSRGGNQRCPDPARARLMPSNEDKTWTRGDLERLIVGDSSAWDRALVAVECIVQALGRKWVLTTLELDATRDHVVDTLLARDKQRLREIRAPARLVGYLRTVATNHVHYIAGRRVEVLPLHPFSPFASLPRDFRPSGGGNTMIVLIRSLLRLRHVLGNHQFRVLWLCHVEGLSMARIGKALGVSREAIRQAHRRAVSAIESARLERP